MAQPSNRQLLSGLAQRVQEHAGAQADFWQQIDDTVAEAARELEQDRNNVDVAQTPTGNTTGTGPGEPAENPEQQSTGQR